MKNTKLLFRTTFFIFLILPFLAQAQTSWIKNTNTSFIEFKAHIEALGEPNETYAQTQLKRLRKKTKNLALKEQTKEAQKLYLKGDTLKSKIAFQNITRQLHEGDWGKDDRYMLLYSLLRQIQFEDDEEKKKALIKTVAIFKQEKINLANSDYKIFPPPLLKQINKVYENTPSLSLYLKKIFPYHEVVLVNGKQIPHQTKIAFKDGIYRITALSSSYTPILKVTSFTSLLANPIKTTSLTEGLCNFQTIKPQWKEQNVKLFSNGECSESYIQKKLNLDSKNPLKEDNSFLNWNHFTQKDFYKKNAKWILLGAGIITASLIYSLSKPSATGSVTY